MGDKRKFICPEEEGTATDRRPPKIVEYVLQAKDRCPGGELKKPTLFLLHGHRINCEVGSCKTLATYCLQHPFQGCDPEVRLHEWFPGVKDDMPAVIHEGASILLEKKSAQKHSLLTGAYLQHLGDCTVGRLNGGVQETHVGCSVLPPICNVLQFEGGLGEIQRTHKSAPALNRGHQSPVNEHVDGASESHWADVELGAELGLRRKLVSLPVVTVGNATAHRTDDAHVGGFVRIGRRRS